MNNTNCKKCEMLKIFTCFGCDEYMFRGTRMCKTGHTSCESCAKNMRYCLCGGDWTDHRNLLLQKTMAIFMGDPVKFMQAFSGGCGGCSRWEPQFTSIRRRKKNVRFKDKNEIFLYYLD